MLTLPKVSAKRQNKKNQLWSDRWDGSRDTWVFRSWSEQAQVCKSRKVKSCHVERSVKELEALLLGNVVGTVSRERTDSVSGASASFCTLFCCPRYFCSSTVSVLHTQLDQGDPHHPTIYMFMCIESLGLCMSSKW